MFIPVKAFINLKNKFWILSTNYFADKKWINSEENTQITLISNQQIISFVGTDFIVKTDWHRSELFFTIYTTLFQSCIVVCVNVFSFKNREMLWYWYHIPYTDVNTVTDSYIYTHCLYDSRSEQYSLPCQ